MDTLLSGNKGTFSAFDKDWQKEDSTTGVSARIAGLATTIKVQKLLGKKKRKTEARNRRFLPKKKKLWYKEVAETPSRL